MRWPRTKKGRPIFLHVAFFSFHHGPESAQRDLILRPGGQINRRPRGRGGGIRQCMGPTRQTAVFLELFIAHSFLSRASKQIIVPRVPVIRRSPRTNFLFLSKGARCRARLTPASRRLKLVLVAQTSLHYPEPYYPPTDPLNSSTQWSPLRGRETTLPNIVQAYGCESLLITTVRLLDTTSYLSLCPAWCLGFIMHAEICRDIRGKCLPFLL